jgi:hypothetical protein
LNVAPYDAEVARMAVSLLRMMLVGISMVSPTKKRVLSKLKRQVRFKKYLV